MSMSPSSSDGLLQQAPQLLLRLGVGVVFTVFGVWKAMTPMDWIIFTPSWVANLEGLAGLDTFGFLKLMGFFELVLGVQLLLGLFTRWSAALCTLGLAGIVLHVGFDQVGVRDVGLLLASAALWASGAGAWSLDRWMEGTAESLAVRRAEA